MSRIRPVASLARIGLIVSGAVIAVLVVAGSAFAAVTDNVVDIFHGPLCQTDTEFGVTSCVDGHSVFHVHTSASGNTSITQNSNVTQRLTTTSGCAIEDSGTFHSHTLIPPDQSFQEDHALSETHLVFSDGCGVPAFVCDFTEHFHFANGQFQFERFTNVCVPEQIPNLGLAPPGAS